MNHKLHNGNNHSGFFLEISGVVIYSCVTDQRIQIQFYYLP